MLNRKFRNAGLLVLTAFIWGIAFVAQSKGGNVVGPFSFNAIRFILGGVVLLPVICLLDRLHLTSRKPVTKEEWKLLWKGGILCGSVLFMASSLQQLGLYVGTSAGKAGFLTACYIVIVPILGMFFGKKCGWNIWVGVGMTLLGLYLLCMSGAVQFETGDLFVMACACLFAVHILTIDHFSPLVDGVRMSCIQFFVCGIWNVFPMYFFDLKHSFANLSGWLSNLSGFDAWIPILYAGVMSSGVAYTLQIVGQEGLNPTIASLIMSLESVFSVLAGWILLGEKMSGRELSGCILIFAAIVLAQLPMDWKAKSRKIKL